MILGFMKFGNLLWNFINVYILALLHLWKCTSKNTYIYNSCDKCNKFPTFWTVRSKFSAYSCACLFPIESSLLTSKMNLLALLQKSKVLFSKPFLTHSRRLSIINNYICHWSQKERKLSHLELNHGKLSIQNEKEMLMNVKKWMYR